MNDFTNWYASMLNGQNTPQYANVPSQPQQYDANGNPILTPDGQPLVQQPITHSGNNSNSNQNKGFIQGLIGKFI